MAETVEEPKEQNSEQPEKKDAEKKDGDQDRRTWADEAEERNKKPRRRLIFIGIGALVLLLGLLYYWRSTYYENTDDAQVDGHLEQVSARINGTILKVNVQENQTVQAGQVMVELDPRDYEVALQQAQANLASAEANWKAAQSNIPVTSTNTTSTTSSASADVRSSTASIAQAERQLDAAKARLAEAQANDRKSQLDLARYTPLVQKDVISKQQYDQTVATAESNHATVAEAEANIIASEENVRISRDKLLKSEADFRNSQTGPQQVAIQRSKADQAQAQYLQAKAQVDQAQLNLNYTKLVAASAGIISRKTVEVGQNVGIGQAMMTLVSLDDIWITANFKETQLRHMYAGQPVVIHVDAYDRDYHAKISQIGGATGSMLSLFPPENATGNYVKVVQRIPVRIDFTNLDNENRDHLLRPGLSVEPKVRVKN